MDVKSVASKVGIRDIIEVPSKLIEGKHALLFYFRDIPPIIFLNKEDGEAEQLFSIAHEIFHYFFSKYKRKDMQLIA